MKCCYCYTEMEYEGERDQLTKAVIVFYCPNCGHLDELPVCMEA
jgi:hypothetical protein